MPLNPPPEIDLNLGLMVTVLRSTAAPGRDVEVTYAVHDIGGALSVQQVADACQLAFQSNWKTPLDDAASVVHTLCTLGDGTTVPRVAVSTAAPTAGTNVITASPANSNALLKKGTGLAGRKNRGRTYMPWVFDQTNPSVAGILQPAEVTLLQNTANAWLAALIAAGIPMVIANKTIDTSVTPHRVTNVTLGPDVITLTAEALIASQRRRIGR